MTRRRQILQAGLASAVAPSLSLPAFAQSAPIRIGAVLPFSGGL